jgi:hypothetical protein
VRNETLFWEKSRWLADEKAIATRLGRIARVLLGLRRGRRLVRLSFLSSSFGRPLLHSSRANTREKENFSCACCCAFFGHSLTPFRHTKQHGAEQEIALRH